MSSTGFPFFANKAILVFLTLVYSRIKTAIAIRSLIKAIWPSMKGAAEFSLFEMNK